MHAFRVRTALASLSISASAFFLLLGYELVRSPSNTLYKKAYGSDALVYVMAATPLGVLALLWFYGQLLSLLGPRRTLLASTLLSGVGLAGFTMAVLHGLSGGTVGLYMLREAYIVLIIEQYWSFLNSRLREDEARWFNGPITGLASMGSILGGLVGWKLGQTRLLDVSQLPLLAAASCLPAALCSDLGYRLLGEPGAAAAGADNGGSNASGRGDAVTGSAGPAQGREAWREGAVLGLGQFRRHSVLVFMLLTVVATQLVATSLDLRFQAELQSAMPDPNEQNAWSSLFFAALNAVAAGLQFLVAPLLLQVLPLRVIHMGMPCLHLVLIGAAMWSPSLRSIGGAYIAFKAMDYSVFKAARELLYIPLSFDARYRAKELIDVFGYRCSKGGLSLVASLASKAGFAVGGWWLPAALGASLAWVGLAWGLTRRPAAAEEASAAIVAPSRARVR